MLFWTIKFPKYLQDLNIWNLGFNTFVLVVLSCILMIVLSFIANYGNRITKSKFLDILTTFSISGYAIPGIILAVAFITLVSYLDNLFFINFKTMFIGSILGLVVAYFVRFFALSCNGIKSGYLKINRSIDESAYLLGYSKFKTFTKVHIPYLKNSVFLISILIAVEIIKELPITLILRPFNFETFATTAYIYASQDLLEAAAAPSLFLISIASLFILFVSKYILTED
jgi:iron(III) transport system permease protein